MVVVGSSSRRLAGLALATAALALAGSLAQVPVKASVDHIDPAVLPRGADPAVIHLVRDTIRDGGRRIPATRRGEHEALWAVSGGYIVRDYNVGPRRVNRLVFVDLSGGRREIARSRDWIDVEVSLDGTRLAYQRSLGPTGVRASITVENARSGRVIASRGLRLATLVAVDRTRVLLGRRSHWQNPATEWWNYRRDRLKKIHDQAAVRADLRHDRVVFETPRRGEFCHRVAVLSRPARTLWRSCRISPHQWSPDGQRFIATHTYFDAAGTDTWWVLDARTAEKELRITGRLDWDAVWEDDQHFVTLAQSDEGKSSILRCHVSGECERASRLWEIAVPSEPSLYYASPPVVLGDRARQAQSR